MRRKEGRRKKGEGRKKEGWEASGKRSGVLVPLLFSLFFLFCPFAFAQNQELLAPAALPNVTHEMQTAGCWISRHPSPDKLVMSPVEIVALNARMRQDRLINDLMSIAGAGIKKEIVDVLEGFKARELFQGDGQRVSPEFLENISKEMALDSIGPQALVRYGLTVEFANERLMPTDNLLSAKPGDVNFDELQNSGLDPETPVVILHQSQSGAWLYVKDEISFGWVKAGQVALISKDEFAGYIQRKDVAIVTSAKANVFLDRMMTTSAGIVRMGVRLVLKNSDERVVEALWPERQADGTLRFRSGFIPRIDVSLGALPFTARTILSQAFKLLNAPYGWGDMNGEQDCSRFVQMVFATVGIAMPRNSAEQGQVGALLGEFTDKTSREDKLRVLSDKALGGLTVLRLKGHIMLFLGMVDRNPYTIHATWAYREKTASGEQTRVIGRVAVTDLSLGDGSSKGSLLDRIVSVRSFEKSSLLQAR